MDPNACWQRFLDACAEDNHHEALEAICDLSDWILRKGGALPDGVKNPNTIHSLVVFIKVACDVFDAEAAEREAGK
jgi:hypothetical protein